jgi:hypothetical protein
MSRRIRRMSLLPALSLLIGCASPAPQAVNPPPAGYDVVGSGSTADRATINSTDQQMFDAEHAARPAGATASSGQNQGLP